MNPTSPEVEIAVRDWQQDARRRADYTGFYADRVKTEAALFHDAVYVFSSTLRELKATRDIHPHSKRCQNSERSRYQFDDGADSEQTFPHRWEFGAEIMRRMDEVSLTFFSSILFDYQIV